MHIYETEYYDVHFIRNSDEVAYSESGGKIFTHKIETQFQVVNKLLGTVEQQVGNLPHAVFYANSFSDQMREVISGKMGGNFSTQIMQPLVGQAQLGTGIHLAVDNTKESAEDE